MFRGFVVCAAMLIAALSGSAQAQERVQAGSLTCDVSAGIGLIIGSQRNVSCTFTPSLPGPIEYYTGTISKLGVDIGVTAGGVMVWFVYSPTNRPLGALSGTYVGGTAEELRWIAGVGANALVGGSEPRDRAAAGLGLKARSASTSPPASPVSICATCADPIVHWILLRHPADPSAGVVRCLVVARHHAASPCAAEP